MWLERAAATWVAVDLALNFIIVAIAGLICVVECVEVPDDIE